ncbi:MAG: AraC family transcriptional regulator [Alphaproteobacteria bacterium]|nr:AraC family transcriptional regulator [Alphaproteobacteria bacterium]
MSQARGIIEGRFGRVALLDIDRPVVGHAHPHCHVLFKIAGADSVFRVCDRIYPLLDDTAVLVNAWEPHAYPHRPSESKSLILALYVDPGWLAAIERDFAVSADPDFFARPCVEVAPEVRKPLRRIAEALLAGEASRAEREALLFDVMSMVIDKFSEWRVLRGARPSCTGRVRDFRVRRAIDLLSDQLDERPRIDSVARAAGISRAHLFERFKTETGLTPTLFQNMLRMEAAYAVLPEPGETLAAISARLGFSAQSHFSRFFRNNLGVSPSAYRRAVQPR